MTQKEDIETLLQSGKSYDEIEDQTGSNRSYIRSIAVSVRKNQTSETEDELEETPSREKGAEVEMTPGMNFVDDHPIPEPVDKERKNGSDYHKEWVKAAKYECGFCGATIGKTSSFCPHCGKILSWEGIE